MARIAIIGGKLQGIEAVWLSRHLGWQSLLIDRKPGTPASGIASETHLHDVCQPGDELIGLLKSADLILPALEDDEALDQLVRLSRAHSLPLAFDPDAYAITSDKLRSDEYIRKAGVPVPTCDPQEGPAIVKPARGSGSVGVHYFPEASEARRFLAAHRREENPEPLVFQEFVPGRSFSVEVIGVPGDYRTFPITEIHVDDVHDCHLVTTPCPLPRSVVDGFRRDAVRLAEAVSLHGIMDVETIYDERAGVMKTLEIDARLPSQTPAAILASTGINLLAELVRSQGCIPSPAPNRRPESSRQDPSAASILPAAYENILVSKGQVISAGEHIMGEAGPLRILPGFCGAEATLTDYKAGMKTFRCISVHRGKTFRQLAEKRRRHHQLLSDPERAPDEVPAGTAGTDDPNC